MSDFVQRHFPGLCESSLFRVMVWQWMAIGLALLTAVGLGAALSRLFHVVSRSVVKRPDSNRFVSLSRAIQNPLAGLIALGALSLALHFIALGGHVGAVFDKGIAQLFIGEGAWLLVGGGRWLTADLETRLLGADEFSSRGARTQLRLAHYVWSGLVVLMALALILSGFRVVRTIGVSLLASAGILGIVVGITAQKSIGGLVAGIQLAVTQQVRIGDTVIVDTAPNGVCEQMPCCLRSPTLSPSVLGPIEKCQALAHAILSGYKDVQGAQARFDFRFDAIVRCTFAYFETTKRTSCARRWSAWASGLRPRKTKGRACGATGDRCARRPRVGVRVRWRCSKPRKLCSLARQACETSRVGRSPLRRGYAVVRTGRERCRRLCSERRSLC